MTVFISRNLRPDSVFYKTLHTRGIRVHGERLVEFTGVPFDEIPGADWLFFYSKTGVHYFFQHATTLRVENYRLAAIGKGTSEYLARICRPADFAGDGDPVSTATAFLQLAKGQKVLFIRAEDSRQSIRRLLGQHISPLDLVVYKNQPRTSFNLPHSDCLVFTSPLNAQAYFSKYPFRKNQKVVAIGRTTAVALEALGVKNPVIAGAPSEEALAKAVLNRQ
ncbi:MAG: uroporphyrinogen-III synthase [Saprospiraceae bacterium]